MVDFFFENLWTDHVILVVMVNAHLKPQGTKTPIYLESSSSLLVNCVDGSIFSPGYFCCCSDYWMRAVLVVIGWNWSLNLGCSAARSHIFRGWHLWISRVCAPPSPAFYFVPSDRPSMLSLWKWMLVNRLILSGWWLLNGSAAMSLSFMDKVHTFCNHFSCFKENKWVICLIESTTNINNNVNKTLDATPRWFDVIPCKSMRK